MNNTSDIKNILVTGAGGQLGQELQFVSVLYPRFKFIFTSKSELDISDQSAIRAFINKNKIHYCINAAAYTQVDQAESDNELNNLINTTSVGYLSKALSDQGATLVHISSDYVYHNDKRRPLLESDPTTPRGAYARAKLGGEKIALQNNDKTIVIRTSWVFSSYGNNFVKTMIRLLSDRDEISVVHDQIGCPTYARDLARAILDIIVTLEEAEHVNPVIYKIYNYCNKGTCSWYVFASKINALTELNKTIHSIPSIEYPTPAPRPAYSVLDTSLIQSTFDLHIRQWDEALVECLAECNRQ